MTYDYPQTADTLEIARRSRVRVFLVGSARLCYKTATRPREPFSPRLPNNPLQSPAMAWREGGACVSRFGELHLANRSLRFQLYCGSIRVLSANPESSIRQKRGAPSKQGSAC